MSGPYQPCTEGGSTPSCPNEKCSEKTYATAWNNDKHYAKSAYSLNSVEEIMTDIYKRGPVTGAFSVYEDFLSKLLLPRMNYANSHNGVCNPCAAYKSGVYQHTSGRLLGGHAIKIMGWGEENGTPYWLVANSWNTYWGDQGTFKILRGENECGIEDDVVAGSV